MPTLIQVNVARPNAPAARIERGPCGAGRVFLARAQDAAADRGWCPVVLDTLTAALDKALDDHIVRKRLSDLG
jgi:hypothetical protein